MNLDLTPEQMAEIIAAAGAGLSRRRPMPEYNFVKDILTPYLRAGGSWKAQSTLRVEAGLSRPLERLFKGYWITAAPSDMRKHRLIITGQTVAQYRDRRKLEGLCANSIHRELVVASGACKYAITELNLDIPNPFAGRTITRKDQRTVQPRKRLLGDDEQLSLLIACQQPLRDMILLWLETGLRVNELRLLRHEQIAIDEKIIRFRPEEHKSGTFDACALTDDAIALIGRQPTREGCPYVFQRDGTPMAYTSLWALWNAARKTAGCADLQMRDLRRTGLQQWRNAFGIEAAQAQARHKDRRTTERVYARPSVEIAVEALKKNGSLVR